LLGENELIGRPAKFDRTTAEPLKLRELRASQVDKCYARRVNILAGDLPEALHNNRDSKLGALRRPKPCNANEVDLHDKVSVSSRHVDADGFVHDSAIARKESPRFFAAEAM
jgi:hypothetical protein